MARAARDPLDKAARLGLLAAALSTACASMGAPPGGPPDFDPPVILSITPDSGAVVDGFDDDLVIQFDEVISERSGNGLENLILLSPRAEEIDVSWKRSAIEIRPKGGWIPNIVYNLTLLRGIADLRNNRLDSARTIIFSTGGEIPATRVSGTVLNWEEGRGAPRALVELTLLPDSLVYFAEADSLGDFDFASLPPGQYILSGTIDKNSNRQRDFREWFDSVTVQLDSTVSAVLWAFSHDSIGPRIRNAVLVDSVTVRLNFTLMLQPGIPVDTAVEFLSLPDSQPVTIAAVWNATTYDSVKAAEDSVRKAAQAAEQPQEADSAAADSAAADSVAAAVDTAAQIQLTQTVPDTGHVVRLLATRPKLSADWHVRLVTPLIPGTKYLIVARAANVLGHETAAETILSVPAAVDST